MYTRLTTLDQLIGYAPGDLVKLWPAAWDMELGEITPAEPVRHIIDILAYVGTPFAAPDGTMVVQVWLGRW